MVGREVQRVLGHEPQVCITLPILRGLDGERRMGKSLGNHIGVAESPRDQFFKVMSIPDTIMADGFELLTDSTHQELGTRRNPEKTHRKEAKKALARDVVRFCHGDAAAAQAQAAWEREKEEGHDRIDIPEVPVPASEAPEGRIPAFKLLVLTGLAKSGNDARRLLQGGGVTIGPDREKITEPTAVILQPDGLIVRVGPKTVIRIRLS